MVWELSIQKQLGTEYWINVYHADVPAQDDARATALAVVNIERAVHSTDVLFVNFRVRNISPIAGPGTVYPVGLVGQLGAASYLPLFNVARCDIAVPVGRPDRKYLKFPISNVNVTNGRFTQAALDFWQANYCDAIIALTALSDRSGQPYLSASINPAVGMRQLRRGTRKKSTPIIS